MKSDSGFVFDMPVYLDRLMRSEEEGAFLIINVAHSKDFLQLTGSPDGVQLDFPMITSGQQSQEQRIREVASAEGLTVIENYGSNGARFLDIDIEGPSRTVATMCSKILRKVFHVTGSTDLVFQHVGLASDRPD